MKSSIRWLIGVLIIIFVIFCFIFFTIATGRIQNLQKEAEDYRKQLIALCAAEDHAFMQGWDIKEIYLHGEPVGPDGYYETAISFDAVKKNWNGTETKIRYTVFQGGKVVITGSDSWEKTIQEMDLGSSMEFSKIGKK